MIHISWTAPRTWVTSELVTAALMNTHVRDNLLQTAPALVTTKGDVVAATGANALARVAVGTKYTALVAQSSEASGVIFDLPYHANVRARHSANQTVNGGATTALAFDGEGFDPDAMHDPSSSNSRLTCVVAGVYLIGCHVQINAGSAAGLATVKITSSSGPTDLVEKLVTLSASVNVDVEMATIYRLAVNDYVEVYVTNPDGGTSLTVGRIVNVTPIFYAVCLTRNT